MKGLVKLFGVALVVLAISVPVVALTGSSRVKVDVPFAFSAGEKTLPAGEYSLQEDGGNRVVIRDADRQVMTTVLGRNTGSFRGSDAKVVFHRYGNAHFLAVIDAPGFGSRELARTDAEREAAEDYRNDPRYRVDVAAEVDE